MKEQIIAITEGGGFVGAGGLVERGRDSNIFSILYIIFRWIEFNIWPCCLKQGIVLTKDRRLNVG